MGRPRRRCSLWTVSRAAGNLVVMRLSTLIRFIERHGIVLESDPVLPSLVALIVGAPVRGSWWGHPKGREIFALLEGVVDHPDVLTMKLVAGKVTFVHRRLWAAVLAIGAARQPWQTRGLSAEARRLLRRVDRGEAPLASGRAATDLERRLLVHAEQVHTDSGAHRKRLQTWEQWRRRVHPGRRPTPARAKRQIEEVVASLGPPTRPPPRVPWPR